MKYFFRAVLVLLGLLSSSMHAEETLGMPETEVTVVTHDGNELSLYQYPAKGDYLLLWLGSGYGFHDRTTKSALEFAKRGIEVWQIDFADALFQTSSSNFIRNLDARYVADIIDAAHQRTGKHVILFARSYGAIPVLRGATLWNQRDKHFGKLLGAILFSPDLITSIPPLGEDPEYLPIIRATDIPIVVLQGGSRGTALQFSRLISELTSKNPNVYFSILPGVIGVFNRVDASPESVAKLKALPDEMPGYIKLLEATPYRATIRDYVQPGQTSTALLDIKIKPFTGKPAPIPFTLRDINGQALAKKNFGGKVTIVNFWATWCPPCVEEIPSLNRLRENMQGKPFELISINYAETPEVVSDFMQRVSVKFPVLMDLDGNVSQQWNVIAFPSTFVIGMDGKIHYGINAAIRWDDAEVVAALNALIK